MGYKLIKLTDGVEYPVTLFSVDQDETTEFPDLVVQLPDVPGLTFCLPSIVEGNFATVSQTFTFPLSASDFTTEQAGTLTLHVVSAISEGGLYFYPFAYEIPRIAGFGTAGFGQHGYGVSRSTWIPPELPRVQILYVPFNSGILPTDTSVGGFVPGRVR